MALIRCTCIYRPREPDEPGAGGLSIAVACRDPQCPAGELHERADRVRAQRVEQ